MSNTTQLIFNTFNSSNSNPNYPEYFLKNPIENITSYAFSNFSGVNNYNIINHSNHNISFVEDSPTTIRNITIPVGNYTISELTAAVKLAMDTAGTAVYTVTAETGLTNLITISATKTFKLLDTPNNMYYELGYDNISTQVLGSSQIGSSIYDLSGINELYIVSSSFGTNNSVLINTNYTIMARVPILTPYLGVISFSDNIQFIDCQINSLSNVQFFLMDSRMRRLTTLNDWSISVYVKTG